MHQPTILAYFPSNLEAQTSIFENRTKTLIAASEATIARLEAKISEEETILAYLRSTVAPVRNVPAELLSRIFLLSVLDIESYGRSVITARLALTQVCARWRRVAHTTPQLWTVSIPAYGSRETLPEDHCTQLRSWMDRSAPLPLPVSSHCLWYRRCDPVQVGLMMDTLCTAARRWSDAFLRLPSLSYLGRIPPRSLERLTSLTLEIRSESNSDVDSDADPDIDPAEIVAFSDAPQLRELDLNIPLPDRLPIPWSQLTSLTLHAPPFACLNILERCSALTFAEIEMEGWESPPDLSSRSMTTITGLTTLELDLDQRAGHFIPLLTCLWLPELDTLRLRLSGELIWDATELSRFQLRSPNLRCLAISDSDLDADALLAVLRSSPSLATLEIYNCWQCFTDVVITALRYTESDAVHLAPKLQTLLLECVGDHFDAENLATTIVSRWWTDKQLAAMSCPPAVARWEKIHISIDDEEESISCGDHFTGAFWQKVSGCKGLEVKAG